jgi:hypothetical protein
MSQVTHILEAIRRGEAKALMEEPRKRIEMKRGAHCRTMNANGVPSLSPGLERSDYPGFAVANVHNPEGVASIALNLGCNPFRVDLPIERGPRVARAAGNPGLDDGTPLALPGNS